MSVSDLCITVLVGLGKVYIPVHECIASKYHAKELCGVLWYQVSVFGIDDGVKIRTKPTTRYGAFFAILVVLLPQLLVTEDLICFSYLLAL
jgi:hypothetical protein